MYQTWSRYKWHVIPEILPIGAYWAAGGLVDSKGRFTLNGLPLGKQKFKLFKGSEPVKEIIANLPLSEGNELIIDPP